MGGCPRTLVGLLIGAALGTSAARAASLRASFDPSSDPVVDTYLVFDCRGDATICTQDSFVSASETWTQVASQPASVVCAATPCAETFSVADPAAGQTETLTVAMVAESQAASPGAPLLSGPSNVISVTLVGASTSSSTSSTSSTTQAPTTSTLSTSTTSSTSFTTTTTSITSSTTLPPGTVCGHPSQPGGGLSVGWDTYAGIPCITGNDSTGYVVVDGHVYAGQPGDPPSFKLALYENTGTSWTTREPAGTPLCESDIVTLEPGDNLIPLAGCPVLAPSTRYYIVFVAASPDTQIGDVQSQPCTNFPHGRTGRHTSALDSLSDPFPDADAVPWLNDYCQETLWLDLAPAGQ